MSKFNKVFYNGECLDGFQVINLDWNKDGVCKRCGKPFIKKYRKQIFCSRECVSGYRNKIKEIKDQYGKKFTDWLNNRI